MVGRTTWRHIQKWAGQHRDRFEGGQGKAEADSAVGRTTHRQIRQLTGKRGDRFGCGQDNGMQIWQWAGQRGVGVLDLVPFIISLEVNILDP